MRLFFPDAVKGGAELWTTAKFLSFCSPYIKTLLSSKLPAKRSRSDKSAVSAAFVGAPAAEDSYDSDDETDELFFEHHPHHHEAVEQEYKEINITRTAFSTYRAVLAYLRTGYITFAPLASRCGAEATEYSQATPTRRTQVESAAAENPDIPYLVSPKSTYRLAHLLDLTNLQTLCLMKLSQGGLTVNSAPAELFDETCVLFEPWRQVVVEYIAQHWAKVKETTAWKEIEQKLDADEIPGAMPIMLQLFKAREKYRASFRPRLFFLAAANADC